MIARFFHAWEHRLASATKDRVVRPFEWGVDWLGPNGHDGAAHDVRVERWVDEVMRDTRAFFDAPPTRDYDVRRGDTLRFPSALVTPHPENNTVVGALVSRAGRSRR